MILDIFTIIIVVLGLMSFTFLVYTLILIISDKIKDVTAERRKMKSLEGKIDKINDLIIDIHNKGGRVKAKGKYLILYDVLEVELSDKEVK